MKVTYLSLKNFKGLKDFKCDINPFETYFAGPNGSGKTTAIDALFFALRGMPPGMKQKDTGKKV